MNDASSTTFAVDPEDLRIPEELPLPSHDRGEVVILLAEEGARGEGWSARFAVQLARRWGSEGFHVFLGDGDLSDAPLHSLIGVPNAEGLSDVILHGASPGRVAQRTEGSAFLFASAGTIVADPSEVYEHPRWSSVLSAFRESGSVFVLYLPSDTAASELVALSDRVIRLEDGPPVDGGDGKSIVVHEASPDTEGAVPGSDPGERVASAESVTTETAGKQGEEVPQASLEVESAGGGPVEEETTDAEPSSTGSVEGETVGKSVPDEPSWPAASKRVERRRGSRAPLILLTILLILVALVLMGQQLGYIDLPGVMSGLRGGPFHPSVPTVHG